MYFFHVVHEDYGIFTDKETGVIFLNAASSPATFYVHLLIGDLPLLAHFKLCYMAD